MQLLANEGHEGRDTKPSKETEEERDPRDVEGTNLDAFEGEELEIGKRGCGVLHRYVVLCLNNGKKAAKRKYGYVVVSGKQLLVVAMPTYARAADRGGDIAGTVVWFPAVARGAGLPKYGKKFIEGRFFTSAVL